MKYIAQHGKQITRWWERRVVLPYRSSAEFVGRCAGTSPAGFKRLIFPLAIKAKQRGDCAEEQWDVFLSHAGEQKKDFVDLMHAWLTVVHQRTCFLDEYSLRPGDDSWPQIEKGLRIAPVGVVVLTAEYVRKHVPMRELQILLRNRMAQPEKALFAVFHGYDVEQCCSFQGFRALYETEPWVGGEEKPVNSVLDAWAKDVVELCRYCGVRQDQARHYQGQLVRLAVESVIRCLYDIGKDLEGDSPPQNDTIGTKYSLLLQGFPLGERDQYHVGVSTWQEVAERDAAPSAHSWDVFISHAGNQADKPFARALKHLLESYGLGLRVFLDDDSLKPSTDPEQATLAAMESTQIALLLFSKEYFEREATKREMEVFLERHASDRMLLFPVFLRLTVEECAAELGGLLGTDHVNLPTGVRHKGEPSSSQQGFEKTERETMWHIATSISLLLQKDFRAGGRSYGAVT